MSAYQNFQPIDTNKGATAPPPYQQSYQLPPQQQQSYQFQPPQQQQPQQPFQQQPGTISMTPGGISERDSLIAQIDYLRAENARLVAENALLRNQPSPYQQPGQYPPQPGQYPVPPHHHNVPIPRPKCSKGHSLDKCISPGQRVCDGACKNLLQPGVGLWRCLMCQYDICFNCGGLPSNPPPPQVQQLVPFCSRSHAMEQVVAIRTRSCDRCRTHIGLGVDQWRCGGGCDFDLCGRCAALPFRSIPRCSKDPSHGLAKVYTKGTHKCDLCRCSLPSTVQHWRCGVLCDFDICQACYNQKLEQP